MLAQFDNNPVATNVPYVPNFDDVCSGSEFPAEPVNQGSTGVAAQTQSSNLIDWNLFHPDGTDSSIQSLLQVCGKRLGAEIHFGRTLPNGGVKQLISSSRLWTRENAPPSLVTSSVIEASLAPQTYLTATSDNHNSGVLNCFRQTSDYRAVFGFGIRHAQCPAESDSGILVCLGNSSSTNPEELIKAMPQFRRELAFWLQTWLAVRHTGSRSMWSIATARLAKHRVAVLIALIVSCGISVFIPAPYWPRRECIVEPSTRQFVASPIEGRFLHSLVRPGDVVTAGQVIGQLDDEHIRWEIGSAEAELQAAQKHRDSALANRDGGKLRLAQFEQQQIAIKIQSLNAQLDKLELRSPVDGIILQGEWFRSEGAPVARGDTLFEIATLDQMTVEVHLATDDLGEVEVGDHVTVRVDSAIGNAWAGKISRIDPRAAVIGDKICFVADVEVDNAENRLRPGMKGTARVTTGFKSIGWLVFHRPYRWLMKNIVW